MRSKKVKYGIEREEKPCEMCNQRPSCHIHHLDGDHDNNDKKNLQHICAICHCKVHGITPQIGRLRLLVDQYEKIQKTRIQLQAAVRNAGQLELELPEIEKQYTILLKTEKEFPKVIKKELKIHPISKWLLQQKGISTILAGKLISRINITKAPSVSSLWSYAGLAPGTKRKKGQKSNWNQKLKKDCYIVGDQFLKVSNKPDAFYGKLYKQFRADYDKREELTKGQCFSFAKRKVVKIFLQNLWVEWRQLEGLPISEPYVIAQLHHAKLITNPIRL